MSNLAYVRFQNTYKDLQDCEEHLFDENLGPEEEKYRRWLIDLCVSIAEDVGELDALEDEDD